MNEELDKTEAELDKVKEELHKAKEELAKAKEELDKTREESHKTVIISISNEELDKIRKIKDTPSDDRKKGGCWIPAFFYGGIITLILSVFINNPSVGARVGVLGSFVAAIAFCIAFLKSI